MAMHFHQKRFFPYTSGAPSLHTLSSASSPSHVLVTTDRSVAVLGYNNSSYSLQELDVDSLRAGSAEVMASGVITRPESQSPLVAVAYALKDDMFLQIVGLPRSDPQANGKESSNCDTIRFNLAAAPMCVFSVQAHANGSVFHGVILCSADSMTAFGFVEDESKPNKHGDATAQAKIPTTECTRLSNDQFAGFFPEFATFTHPVLSVDIFTLPARDQGWTAFGCADGFIRVFQGQLHHGCLTGPFKTKDFQLNGPVTAVAVFPKAVLTAEENMATEWQINLLATCAIGQAVVYEHIFHPSGSAGYSEVLTDSETFDSIFAGVTADIDLDGDVELLLGTDSQVMLAYKQEEVEVGVVDGNSELVPNITDHTTTEKTEEDTSVDDPVVLNSEMSSETPSSPLNIWSEVQSSHGMNSEATSEPQSLDEVASLNTPEFTSDVQEADVGIATYPLDLGSVMRKRQKWQRLSRRRWDMETFGAIYSLLWRDINQDGVSELLIASTAGVYVYEADPSFVIKKLERVMAELATSTPVAPAEV